MVILRTAGVLLLVALTTGAKANCSSLPAAVTQPMVERVILNAGSLLEQNRDGESGLAGNVAVVLQTNSRLTLQPILRLIGRANARQKTQIGRGFASAISACRRFEPETTRTIEKATRDITDRDVLAGLQGGRAMRVPPTGSPSPGLSESNSSLAGPFGSSGRSSEPSGRIGQRDLRWDPFGKQGLPGSSVSPISPLKTPY